jgi:tyrosine-protein phosphatase YwqE
MSSIGGGLNFDKKKHDEDTQEFDGLDFKIKVKVYNENLARLFFLGKDNLNMKIPKGIVLKDISNKNDIKVIEPIEETEFFIIEWSKNYVIEYEDRKIYQISKQKRSLIHNFLKTGTVILNELVDNLGISEEEEGLR